MVWCCSTLSDSSREHKKKGVQTQQYALSISRIPHGFPSSKKKGKGLLSSGDVGLFVLGKACGIFHPNTSLSVCMIACTFMQLLNIPNSETRSTHIGISICA